MLKIAPPRCNPVEAPVAPATAFKFIDDVSVPLNLKSYTTTERNALTSAAGDIIYNTTDSKVQFYNGSSWNDL